MLGGEFGRNRLPSLRLSRGDQERGEEGQVQADPALLLQAVLQDFFSGADEEGQVPAANNFGCGELP